MEKKKPAANCRRLFAPDLPGAALRRLRHLALFGLHAGVLHEVRLLTVALAHGMSLFFVVLDLFRVRELLVANIALQLVSPPIRGMKRPNLAAQALH